MKPGSLFSVFLLCGAAMAQQPVVGIFYQFEQEPAAASYRAMVKETSALFDPAGVSVVWRKQGSDASAERFSKVFFVNFKGVCNPLLHAQTVPDEEQDSVRLGSSRVSSGSILPVAEIDCTQLQRFVDRAPAKQRRLVFGWAMARVTAHELYHVLLQTAGHGKRGLSKAVVSASELRSRWFSFNADELQRFGAAFAAQ